VALRLARRFGQLAQKLWLERIVPVAPGRALWAASKLHRVHSEGGEDTLHRPGGEAGGVLGTTLAEMFA